MASRSTDRTRRVRRIAAAVVPLILVPGLFGLAAISDPVRATRLMSRVQLHVEGARPYELGAELALQDELVNCGPVALHNLLRVLDVPSPGPHAIAEISGMSAEGTSLGALVRAAGSLDVPLRARRLALDEVSRGDLPLLAWLKEGHFVTVLERSADGRFAVHDPAAGAYWMTARTLRGRWGGVVADVVAARPAAPVHPEPIDGSEPSTPLHRR